jgi:hypothetical protein
VATCAPAVPASAMKRAVRSDVKARCIQASS